MEYEFNINPAHLKLWRSDSKRSLAARKSHKATIRRNNITLSWDNIFGRTTLPNSSVSLLLIFGGLLAAKTLYA